MASRLQDVIQRGLAAAKPVASTVAPGTLYYSTDAGITERSDGTTWQSYNDTTGGGGGGGPHAATHSSGGSDPVTVTNLAGYPGTTSVFLRGDHTFAVPTSTPITHHVTHEPGGTDPLTVDAAAGVGSLRTIGTGPLQAASGTDARLSDARVPTVHATTHSSGGTDPVTVTNLAGYPGGTTNFLRADGTFAAPAAGSGITQLTSDVVAGPGSGSQAATIANDAVTYAKMQNTAAASVLLGRGTSGAGDPQEIALGTNLTMSGTTLNASGSGSGITALTGDVTASGTGSVAATIANDAVTFAKMQNLNQGRLLGRGGASGTGDTQEITIGTMLSLAGTSLKSVPTSSITVIIDGGGSVLTTGVKAYFQNPYDGKFTSVTLLADVSGSAVIDIYSNVLFNYPFSSSSSTIGTGTKPSLSSANKSQLTTLTGWTFTNFAMGDFLAINIDSISTITKLTVCIMIQGL